MSTSNAVQDGQSPPATPAPSPAAPVLMSLRFVGQGDVLATLNALSWLDIIDGALYLRCEPSDVDRANALLRTLKEIA